MVRRRGRTPRRVWSSVIGSSRSLRLARLAPRAACSRAHDQRQLEHSLCRQLHADVPFDLHKPAARPCLRELRRRGSPPARPAAPPRLPRRPAASANLRAQLAPEGASRAGICAALARERTPPRSCSQDRPRYFAPHAVPFSLLLALQARSCCMERRAPCFTFSSSPTPHAVENALPIDSAPARTLYAVRGRPRSRHDDDRDGASMRAALTQHRPSSSLTFFLSSSRFFLLAGEGAYRRLRAQAGTLDRRSMPLPPLDVQHVALVSPLRPALVPRRPPDRHDLHGRRVPPSLLLLDGRQLDQAVDLSAFLLAPPPLGTSHSLSVRADGSPPSRTPRAGLKALLCTSTLLIPLPSTALRLLGHRLHPPAPPRSRHGRRRRLDRLPRPDPLPPPLLRLVGRHHLLRESSSFTRGRRSQDEQRPRPPTSLVERGAARRVAAGQHADALSLSRSRCREEASWLPVPARCPISGPRSCSSASSPRPSRSCSSRSSSWSSAFGCAFILLARFPHSRVQELTRSPARVQLPQQHAPRAAD